jgi:hypothetical protein
MNGQSGASISEHAFGNALDVSAFKLASGREVKVRDGWKGMQEERGFLRQIFAAACDRFSTVLGPGADAFHYDHFHLDLARRSSARSICKPVPEELPAPISRQNLPMARRQPPMSPQGPTVITRQSFEQPRDLPLNTNSQGRGYDRQESTVGERQQYGRPADLPLNASPQQSPRPVAGPSMVEQPPVYRPPADPNRPLPPRNVGAKYGSDPITTGSVTAKKKDTDERATPMPSYLPLAQPAVRGPETVDEKTLRLLGKSGS